MISDITVPAAQITFRVGAAPFGPSQTASGEQTPNTDIPDDTTGGISSTIVIATPGIVRRIKVEVDITHTFIGDLHVELFAPSGRRATLHGRLGGSADDLFASFDSDRPGELSSLVGQGMQGTWVLRVSDRAAQDIGVLRRWRLELTGA